MTKRKPFEPTPENDAAKRAIGDHLAAVANGTILSWLEIQQATGIEMNHRGRSLVRAVLKKVKRAYLPIPGSGIQVSSAVNSTQIQRVRTKRIVGAARSAHRSATFVLARHTAEMSKMDRDCLEANRSLTGALVSMSRGGARAVLPSMQPTAQSSLPQLPRRANK